MEDAVVVPSRYLADGFADFAVPTEIIPNAVDLAELRYRPRPLIRPRLLCTRNFQRRYAVDLVVRAFADVRKDFPSAHLVLVGKGPTEAGIRALVRHARLDAVEFSLLSDVGDFRALAMCAGSSPIRRSRLTRCAEGFKG